MIKTYPHYYDPDQLYDLAEDPDEQNNVWGEEDQAERQEALRDLMESYLVTLPGKFQLTP